MISGNDFAMATELMTIAKPPASAILVKVRYCSGVGFFPGAFVSIPRNRPARHARQSTVVAPIPVGTGQNWYAPKALSCFLTSSFTLPSGVTRLPLTIPDLFQKPHDQFSRSAEDCSNGWPTYT